MSSLLARAHWCVHSDTIDPKRAGTCTRVVAETLDLLLPALMAQPRGVDDLPKEKNGQWIARAAPATPAPVSI